ncbi:MAG: glycoside hydrolase family 9 protein, partial [Verrucomicrobiota bacterium]
MRLIACLVLLGCGVFSLPVLHAEEIVVEEFDRPLLFTYLSFKDKVSHTGSELHIQTKDSKGGGGTNITLDASTMGEWVPVLRLKRGEANRAARIRMQLVDRAEKKRFFDFEISALPVGEWVEVAAVGAAMVAGDDLDLRAINVVQIQGTWSAFPIDLQIDRLTLRPPGEAALKLRQAMADELAEKQRQAERKAAREEEQLETLLTSGSEHPEDGAEVFHVSLLGDKRIGIEIFDRKLESPEPTPYVAEPGDERQVKEGKPYLAWKDGKPAFVPREVRIKRNGEPLGILNESTGLIWREDVVGTALDLRAIDSPRAYRLIGPDGVEMIPTAVSRKSKPRGLAQGIDAFGGHHFIYLDLPKALAAGETYRLKFYAVNTREAEVEFVADAKSQRSEAIHVSHLGFRPDDPFKRAYLSLWMGTGGEAEFQVDTFALIDESGEEVFAGEVIPGIDADTAEPFVNRKNHTQADVAWMDFSEFTEPGSFRVYIPGLGTSYPFVIGEQVWEDAFKVSLKGLLHHRSGIELGPPFTTYERPRPFHPEDGIKIYQLGVQIWDGEASAVKAEFEKLLGPDLDPSGLTEVPEAWGGYMDAGDWDRRTPHLQVTLSQLELYEMAPDYFDTVALALPADEAANEIPDLLDEALWNLDFFRRMQQPDGGVRGGVE